jgi:hypothetical protein
MGLRTSIRLRSSSIRYFNDIFISFNLLFVFSSCVLIDPYLLMRSYHRNKIRI